MNDNTGIREMLKSCRVVLASHYVCERVRGLAGPETKIIKVKLSPVPAGVSMVRECLTATYSRFQVHSEQRVKGMRHVTRNPNG